MAIGAREVRAAQQRSNTPSDFGGSTPPPFGADSSTSGIQLRPLEVKRLYPAAAAEMQVSVGLKVSQGSANSSL